MKQMIFNGTHHLMGLCILVVCSSQAIHAQERPERNRINPARFESIVDSFARNADLLQLNDGRLELKFPGREETGDLVIKIMGKISGGGGGGRDSWAFHRHDINCAMMMSKGLRRLDRQWRRMHRYHVEISESVYPFRLLEMTEHEDRLEIFYFDASRKIAFWVVQLQNGVQLTFIEGPDCQCYSASSFGALAKKHDLKPIVSHESLSAFKLRELIADIGDVDDADEAATFKTDELDHLGIYGSARVTLSNLVNLSMNDGKVQIDRESWKTYLGADSAQELIQRAKDDFDATGLPKSWLVIGKERDETSRNYFDFPQIIFEHYLSQIRRNSIYGRGDGGAPVHLFHLYGPRSRTFNRDLDENAMFHARLRMHPPIYGMEEGQQEFLAVNIHDAIARDTRLQLFEKPDESFSLLLRSGSSNHLFWLFQEDGQCWIHHVTMGNASSIKGDHFQDILEKNREIISGDVFDCFREMGVNVGSEIGGPLELENVGVSEK